MLNARKTTSYYDSLPVGVEGALAVRLRARASSHRSFDLSPGPFARPSSFSTGLPCGRPWPPPTPPTRSFARARAASACRQLPRALFGVEISGGDLSDGDILRCYEHGEKNSLT